MEQYWEKHPFQRQIFRIVQTGNWITHLFEWVFMMVSRFSGYAMTGAIGTLIFYALETKHGLDTINPHGDLLNQLANASNVIINVGPELIFPGAVVVCIRAFIARRWLDGLLYLITSFLFATLTLVLLNAFMNNGINQGFLAAMLFWRAVASIFYTIVAAMSAGHDNLDFGTLLKELEALRLDLDTERQTLSSVQTQLDNARDQATKLQKALDDAKQEASRLRSEMDSRVQAKQREIAALHDSLASMEQTHNAAVAHADNHLDTINSLRDKLNDAEYQVQNLQSALEQKRREYESANSALQSANVKIVDLQNAVHESAKKHEAASAKATNITSIDQVRAKHNSGPGKPQKLSHADVIEFMQSHSTMKRAEVAEALNISERKVYDALAWQKEQQNAAASAQ